MVAIDLTEPVVSALRVAGPAFFLGMQGSSIRTALSIMSEKSVGQLSPIPFVSLLTNCVIWTYYGTLRSDMSVLLPNAVGIASGLGCVAAFHMNTKNVPNSTYIISSLIIAFATVCSYLGNYKLLGSLGCVLAVSLMASPLAGVTVHLGQRMVCLLQKTL
eukprot:gene56829-75886_t